MIVTILSLVASRVGSRPAVLPSPRGWKDKLADLAFGVLVFAASVSVGAVIAGTLYIIIRIAFLRAGL